jgi:hypothetical protein
MKRDHATNLFSILLLFCVTTACGQDAAPDTSPASPDVSLDDPDLSLDDLIASVRNSPPGGGADDSERSAWSEKFAKAREKTAELGGEGAARLEAEVNAIREAGGKDDRFMLFAARMIWQFAGLDRAVFIGSIYNEVDITVSFEDYFLPAVEAAKSRDPRAFPIMKPGLVYRKGIYSIGPKAVKLRWPQTVECVWEAYGRQALPLLVKMLEIPEPPLAIEAALHLIGKAQYMEALPLIRKIARGEEAISRRAAIGTLGVFGHPDDFDFLLAGMKGDDAKELWHYAHGLYEFRDLRAVPALVPYMKSEDRALRRKVLGILSFLVWPDGVDIYHEQMSASPYKSERLYFEKFINRLMEILETNWTDYCGWSRRKKEDLLFERVHQRGWDKTYTATAADPPATREQFLEAIESWRTKGRIAGGPYEWLTIKYFMSLASGADIEAICEARAAIRSQFSFESISEASILTQVLQWIGRSRYRAEVWVCRETKGI